MSLDYLFYPPAGGAQPSNPLVIFLHGSGERGTDLEAVKRWGLPKFVASGEIALPAYLVAPQCPGVRRWSNSVAELEALLTDLLANHPIDPNRVLLTGFSMGGAGTWAWALAHPQRFAAILPIGGALRNPGDQFGEVDLTVVGELPIWMVHSAVDSVVAVESADGLFSALLSFRRDIGYTRYPDVDHGESCDRAYRDPVLLQWLLAQKQ